jgi:EAL domain-containing protein (putative c-di-GMP-specific phosphodiesterase class I)
MVGWLASFESGTTPESTAAQICERMTGIGGVAEAVVLAFEADGTSTILAEAGPARPGAMVGNTQSSELTAHFRKRAGEGPWIEAIADRSDPHALVLQAAGLEWVANAPIRFGSELVGRLSISTVGGADPELQAERLATAADLGVLTGAILGGPLAERARLQASRDEIGRIIEGWAFRTVFQPIVDLGTRRVVGHEALTRFEDGMRPDHRFAEADRVGLGAALEVATLESAIRSSVRLPSDTYVSLNASPDLATDIVTVEALVSRVACPVVLEITEHAAIEDYRQLRTALERIRKHVRIAVDDVGAGYAGLRHILELGPDLLKLDIGLVRSVDQDVAKRALINGIIAFARDVGCKIVAEGIETREEERVLADMGVALGQGYLFGKPARIDQIAVDGWVGTAAGRG